MGTVQIDGSTPKLTIGNATAEDATILFDGNAQDFYIALDDSADDLLIGLGSTVGTTPAISIDENLAVKTYGDITMTGATPTLTIGDAGAEDTKIVFDGNAQDFYIALDDSADDLLIGLGSTVGTTPIISIDENKLSTFSGAVTVGVDDTGHDVKFFGATASSYMLWDESADDLNLIASGLGVGTAKDLGTGIHVRTSDSSGTARSLADELVLENSGGCGMTILSGTSNGGFINFGDSGDEDIGSIYYDHNANSMHLYTNDALRMTINNAGIVSISTTETAYSNLVQAGDNGIVLTDTSASIIATDQDAPLILARTNADDNNRDILNFNRNGSTCGQITGTNDTTTYATSSDYRLKENVDYDFDATTRLKQLKPARFNFISDETNTLVDGFLAHEVSSVVPGAIIGEKDAMVPEVLYTANDELPEGKNIGDVRIPTKIKPQGIDPSKLVPLLVKTVQELEARIKTLEEA